MVKYKIYSKTMKLLGLEDSREITLMSISNSAYKYFIYKATCISFFLSLINNSMPLVSFEQFENSSSLNSVSVNRDSENVTSTPNLENELRLTLKDSSLSTSFSEASFFLSKEPLRENSSENLEDYYIRDICAFINNENLSMDGFANLLDMMTSSDGPFGKLYSDKKSAVDALTRENKSYLVKFLIIMVRDGYTYEQLDYMFAGIVGEATGGGHCYADAYAVASTLINRSHTLWYVNQYGHNFYSIFTAPGQYEIEVSGNYLKYLGAIDLEGYHAAIDAFYTRESMHSYLQFRANWVDLNCHYETFATGGNKFLDKMKESQYVAYPEEEVSENAVKIYVLNRMSFK